MATHPAVCMVGVRTPLEICQVPTVRPKSGEVRVKVAWTASTPLDLHQADGGLLVKHPQVMGDGVGGTVVELGPDVKNLAIGDKLTADQVFGFTWRNPVEKGHQEFITTPEFLLGKIPDGFSPQEAVTLPNNFVTVFHAVTTDLGITLPWPRPTDHKPPHADDVILIWGGSSSVGQYALQILRYYGYTNLFATASKAHHENLKSFGAAQVFDYRDPNVASNILEAAKQASPRSESQSPVPFILDCIGSVGASVGPIAKIAGNGTKVAILLPLIIKDASETEAPEYAMEVETSAKWAKGVEPRGVRTHFYLDNEFFKEHLQPTIMPTLLAEGIVKPNKQRIIEGETLIERAQKALDTLRRKEVSGERLVWRVSD